MCAIHELGMARLLSHPLLTSLLTNLRVPEKALKVKTKLNETK